MNKTIVATALLCSFMFMMLMLPLQSLKNTLNLSEIGRMIDTSQSIKDNLETACINALENNLDYSAKTRGVAILKPDERVSSEAKAEMLRYLESYIANGNFESTPSINVSVTSKGGRRQTDGEGRGTNFSDLSQDVTTDGFTGQFPSATATIKYKFKSILSGIERTGQEHTIYVELNHTNILTNDW